MLFDRARSERVVLRGGQRDPTQRAAIQFVPRVADEVQVGIVGLQDPTLNIGDDDADDPRFGEPPKAHFALPQLILRFAARRTFLVFAQLTIDGRTQSKQFVLEHVVVRAGAHRFHRGLLADGSRHDDERQVRSRFPQDGQRRGRSELRHRPVRQDDIPGLPVQSRLHRLCRLNALELDRAIRSLQLRDYQFSVTDGVFDEKHPQHVFHDTAPVTGMAMKAMAILTTQTPQLERRR